MVAGTAAVYTLGACLAAAVSIKPRGTNWNQKEQTVIASCTFYIAVNYSSVHLFLTLN